MIGAGAELQLAYTQVSSQLLTKLFQNGPSSPKPFHNHPRLSHTPPGASLERLFTSNNPRANRRRIPTHNHKLKLHRLACSSESNFTDTFREAGIEVVESLEEAEKQSLKAVSGDVESSPPPNNVIALEPGTPVSSVSEALETIWTEEKVDSNAPLRSLEPEQLMVAAAKVAEALEGEEGHIPGQMYFHMLEPVSPVAAPVMVRDFSETVESSDDEEEEVVGFMIQTEAPEHFAPPPVVEDRSSNGSFLLPSDILLPDDVMPAEDEPLLEPGAVASALMVKEVADALKAPEEDNMSPVSEKDSDSTGVGDIGEKSFMEQLKEIIVFAGPALGIWLSGPIMGIIDTAVIGNSSSLELAALGKSCPCKNSQK